MRAVWCWVQPLGGHAWCVAGHDSVHDRSRNLQTAASRPVRQARGRMTRCLLAGPRPPSWQRQPDSNRSPWLRGLRYARRRAPLPHRSSELEAELDHRLLCRAQVQKLGDGRHSATKLALLSFLLCVHIIFSQPSCSHVAARRLQGSITCSRRSRRSEQCTRPQTGFRVTTPKFRRFHAAGNSPPCCPMSGAASRYSVSALRSATRSALAARNWTARWASSPAALRASMPTSPVRSISRRAALPFRAVACSKSP
jgi:hypothetical protein